MTANHGIFVLKDDDELVEMQEREYDSEALLQGLIARYPNLLAGEQMNSGAPRRWLLIAREMRLAGDESGSLRWSVDHLFLDQDAIPTVVEVKTSSDTRIRREVVGQMLDYAANAVVYWPVEQLRAALERTSLAANRDPGEVVAAFLQEEIDANIEGFWQRVKTNLQAGRIRMVFVADVIPPELRRIVEFLNGQMDPAEVLAVEVKQYAGKGLRTLVPRVIGQTAAADGNKGAGGGQGRQWDERQFMEDLRTRRGSSEMEVARSILEWAKARGLRVWWGKGQQHGSFFPMLDHGGRSYSSISVWTSGGIEMQFQHMNAGSFSAMEKRAELREWLIAIPGIELPEDALRRRPSFPLTPLVDADARRRFLDVLDWVVEEILNASAQQAATS